MERRPGITINFAEQEVVREAPDDVAGNVFPIEDQDARRRAETTRETPDRRRRYWEGGGEARRS